MSSQVRTGGTVHWSDTIFVDAVYGTSGGAKGDASKPFLTIAQALAAASSGDLIYVRQGTYTATASILKNGVNYYFEPGASVSRAIPALTGETGLLADDGNAVVCGVFGSGDFSVTIDASNTQYIGVVNSTNAASDITVVCRSLTSTMADGGLGYSCGINGHGGVIRVTAETIKGINPSTSSGQGVGYFWWSGLNIVQCQSLSGSNNAISTDASTGSSAMDAYVTAEEMFTDGANDLGLQGVINNYSGSNANAALWVTCKTIKSSVASGYCYVYTEAGSVTKFYLECEKAYGQAMVKGGLVYVNSQKVEALANVGSGSAATTALFFDCSAGTLRYNVTQHDPKAFSGVAFLVDGGTVIANDIEYTGASVSGGLSVSSGTARMTTCLLNTAANSSGNPITKSGGTLILMASTLVAEGGRDSITAGTAQNVVAMSSWANKAVNGNVTVTTTGGLTVDSNVV